MIKQLLIIFIIIHKTKSMKYGIIEYADRFSNIISIKSLNTSLCRGTVIDVKYVLTAGRCVVNRTEESISIEWEVSGFTPLHVKKIHVHENYKKRTSPTRGEYHINDIAIITVDSETPAVLPVRDIPLITEEITWSTCETYLIPGWQLFMENGTQLLRSVYTLSDLLTDEQCRILVPSLLDNQHCVLSNFPAVINREDRGSPLLFNGSIVGIIISPGEYSVKPSTVLSTFPYSGFIETIMNDGKCHVRDGEFPFAVFIWRYGSYLCGGFILDNSRIITIATCITKFTSKHLRVKVESLKILSDLAQWRAVETYFVHRNYQRVRNRQRSIRNNIALVILKEPVPEHPTVSKAPLSDQDFPTPRNSCYVLRWVTPPDQVLTRTLMRSPVKILTDPECNEKNIYIAENQFCGTSPYSMNIANPDGEGSLLICEDKLIGIVDEIQYPDDLPPRPTTFLSVHRYTRSEEALTEFSSPARP